jgi:hypothetical protein
LSVQSLFHPMSDYQLFDDSNFWSLPSEEEEEEEEEAKVEDGQKMTTFSDLSKQPNQVAPQGDEAE